MGRRVTVVLITWNSAPYLRRCLEGIARQTHPEVELIHVDNASADASAARVREAFPQCRQILNAEMGLRRLPIRRSESRAVTFVAPQSGCVYAAGVSCAPRPSTTKHGATTGK
jgi:glycosyltransferase involved in cell wall biosynthesis